jgi:hypothetical protein
MPGTFVKGQKTNVLDDVLAIANADWRIGLYTNILTPSVNTVWSDLTEANYSGYNRVDPTFPSATLDASNDGKSTAPVAAFTHSGGATANTVRGWFAFDVTDSELVFVENLPDPKSMAVAGDSISLTLTAVMKQAA